MFPISADKLSFLKIADYWSQESRASQDELLAELEGAWWRGQITGNSAKTRLQVLRRMYESRHDLQYVVFVTPNDPGPQTETALADGGVDVDLTPRISVPNETDDWTEDSCNDAFEELAQLPSQQYFRLFSHSICYIELTPEEFFRWLATRGFEVPKFWKRTEGTGVTQTSPLGSGSSNDLPNPPAVNFTGRGAMKRAIQTAFKARFPNGVPDGTTSQGRDDAIYDWLRGNNIRPKPHPRTIQRAIQDLTKVSRVVAKCRQ